MADLITTTRAARTVSAALLGSVLAVVWSWWALKQGAYFGAVLYPGTILLCATLAVLAVGAPWRARINLSKPLLVALLCLFGLAVWTMLSALWSPAPEQAIMDGQRVMLFLIVGVLGIWLCNLLSGFMQLSMAPLAIAGLVAGVAVVAGAISTSDVSRFLEPDGTLDWPLGYRNANAAFFLLAGWAAVGLAQLRNLNLVLRALASGTAGLCVGIAILCQSRGSVLAAAVALLVYVLMSPERARAILYLLIAAVPAILVLSPASELYTVANESGLDDTATAAALNRAVQVALGAAMFSGLLGAVIAYFDRKARPASDRIRRSNRITLALFLVVVIGGVAAGLASTGDPGGWLDKRIDELGSEQQPTYHGESTRFAVNLQTPRPDLWEVAIDTGKANPVLGAGAGGYRFEYTRERHTDQSTVHDAHNIFLEAFSELGVPGLLMLLGTIIGLVIAAIKARKLGPSAAGLSAIALTVAAYWLVHASLDWFWPYPVITAPVLALMGAAAAPRLLVPADLPVRSSALRLIPALAVILALSTLPPFFADRYLGHAREVWATDFTRAMDDVDRAARYNPISIQPLLTKGAIAREAGNTQIAVDAFTEAAKKRPCEWEAWYQLGITRAEDDPEKAESDLFVASILNPLGPEIRQALEELGIRYPRPSTSGPTVPVEFTGAGCPPSADS